MAKAVDLAYIDKQEPPQRQLLLQLRDLILSAAPTAVPRIAWGMPTYEVCGYVVGICAFKNHVSLFPGGGVTTELASELTRFKTGRGTIQFPLHEKLPAALIKKIVKLRISENIAKASAIPQKDGAAHGKARDFYADGVLKSEGAYRQGELHGDWKWYRKDGSLMRTGTFKEGRQVGTWATYDRLGRLVKQTKFS
jgi:uncharacterized protein YdhG (YjbR/CyaY superfamily)